jgi:hypothetical protein
MLPQRQATWCHNGRQLGATRQGYYTFHASINQRVISIMTAVLFALALPR